MNLNKNKDQTTKVVEVDLSPNLLNSNVSFNKNKNFNTQSTITNPTNHQSSFNKNHAKLNRTIVRKYFDQKYDHYDNSKFCKQVGDMVSRDFQLTSFWKKQYDFIDIFKGVNVNSNQSVLIKIYNKSLSSHFIDIEDMKAEYTQLLNFQSPFVAKVILIEQDAEYIYVIMEDITDEYVTISSILATKGCFTEETARKVFMKVLVAVNHLHSGGYVHRDLNAKNIMINKHFEVKLKSVGSGFTNFAIRNGYIGDYNYYPLEIFNGVVNKEVDYYSLGVLLYIMLSGYTPFQSKNVTEYITNLNTKGMHFNHKELWHITLECKALILSLVNKHPSKRPNPLKALKSFWLEGMGAMSRTNFTAADKIRLIELMKNCLSMTPMEKVLRRSISKKSKSSNLEYLKFIFLKFDVDYDGSFTIDEFRLIFEWLEIPSKELNPQMLFDSMDVSGDGSIEYDEFLAYLSDFDKESLLDNIKVLLGELDQDNDKEIDSAELREMFERYQVSIDNKAFFKLFPENSSKMTYKYISLMFFDIFFSEEEKQKYNDRMTEFVNKVQDEHNVKRKKDIGKSIKIGFKSVNK